MAVISTHLCKVGLSEILQHCDKDNKHSPELNSQLTSLQTNFRQSTTTPRLEKAPLVLLLDCQAALPGVGSQATPLPQRHSPEKVGEGQRDFAEQTECIFFLDLPRNNRDQSLYLSIVSYPKKQERRNCMRNRTFFHWLNSVAYYQKETKLMVRLIILQFNLLVL